MKLIKVLTSWTLIFALATLQVQGTKIVLSSAFAQYEFGADPEPTPPVAQRPPIENEDDYTIVPEEEVPPPLLRHQHQHLLQHQHLITGPVKNRLN